MIRKTSVRLSLIMIIILSLLMIAAAPMQQATGTTPDVPNLFSELGSLVGVGALIAVLINIGKLIGFVKEGTAQNWSVGANIVGIVLLMIFHVFQPANIDLGQIDTFAGSIAQILLIVVGLFVQLASSKLTHATVKGTAVIGKSYSLKQ